ncbi:MAG: hypothetical protein KatS3mg019_0579 [Fimbriimonadales bacterium]|nr:MAG: hypothetical protein KatS3mg019_0579 [Fimbriimonadales bacterium]
MGRKAGWTLIEVLVVIAIILVLAALIYAIGAFAVDRAHQARCITNLRQIGIAFSQYMEDYKRGDWETEVESYTGIEDPQERHRLVAHWGFPRTLDQLSGYLKDKQLLRCPVSRSQSDVSYGYTYPALLIRMPPYRTGQINTWEDPIWVLKQRKWDYPIVSDTNHNAWSDSSLDAKILILILRMDGRVDRKTVTLSDLPFWKMLL